MDIMVLNKNFETIHVIDAYRSMIWTDRYNEAGDFELYTEVSGEVLKYVMKDYYLTIQDSDRTMIVDDIQVISDREVGNHIKITGKSLEILLDRRIVWGLRELNTSLQNGIKALLNENIISPSDSNRKIPNFIFQDSSDSKITNLTLKQQYTGDSIYEIVNSLCFDNDIGYKLILDEQNRFIFSLYTGIDRSYNQTVNPFVIFSPSYENLVDSNYYDSNANLKTIALIGGEDSGNSRRYTTYASSSATGVDRRELFVDARDIQSEYRSEDGTEHKMSDAEYNAALQNRGKEKLAEYTSNTAFEGEVESKNSFIYKEDYYLGDIVQIENEYGFQGTARITEVVASVDESDGYSLYPTFEMIESNT